jgi:hypothetical protein
MAARRAPTRPTSTGGSPRSSDPSRRPASQGGAVTPPGCGQYSSVIVSSVSHPRRRSPRSPRESEDGLASMPRPSCCIAPPGRGAIRHPRSSCRARCRSCVPSRSTRARRPRWRQRRRRRRPSRKGPGSGSSQASSGIGRVSSGPRPKRVVSSSRPLSACASRKAGTKSGEKGEGVRMAGMFHAFRTQKMRRRRFPAGVRRL